MPVDLVQQPERRFHALKTPAWAWFWGFIQFSYGVLFLLLGISDQPWINDPPGIFIGVPFLVIAWGLWNCRRWSLWLGLAHSALLPVSTGAITILVRATQPYYSSYGSPYSSFGWIIGGLCALPFWLINILVFAILLRLESVRQRFKKPPVSSHVQWSLRSMLLLCIVIPVLFGDYAIRRYRISQMQQTEAKWQRELAASIEQFVHAVESPDESLIAAAQARLVQRSDGYAVFDPLLRHLPHPSEDASLRIIAALKSLRNGSPSLESLDYLNTLLENDRESKAVRESLLELLAKATGVESDINAMQDSFNDDAGRREAAARLVGSAYLDWLMRHGAKQVWLKTLLLKNDPDASNTLAPLADLLSKDRVSPLESVKVLRVLGLLDGPAVPAEDAVRECLDDNWWLVRIYAAKLLVQWGHDDPILVDTLRAGLNPPWTYFSTDIIEAGRIEAITALDHLGPKARSAIPELSRCAEDPGIEVREAAERALRQVDPAGEP